MFSVYVEDMRRKALDSINDGVKVVGDLLKAVPFANDQAMIANSQEGLQRIMH